MANTISAQGDGVSITDSSSSSAHEEHLSEISQTTIVLYLVLCSNVCAYEQSK